MDPYPRHCVASARARPIGSIVICAPTLPPTTTAPPPEFDGPDGAWSLETQLCAAVANCFILTFRGIARAAHFNWVTIDCRVEGRLEHIGETTQFTQFATAVRLTVSPGAGSAKARFLVANSLRGERTLSVEIGIASDEMYPQKRSVAGQDIGQNACPNELRMGNGRPS